jgi:hypothetical protein
VEPELLKGARKSRVANMRRELLNVGRKRGKLIPRRQAVSIETMDAAERGSTAMWVKIPPFVLFIWAFTGAFYPA